MKFRKGKYKILYLVRSNSMHQHRLEANWCESSYSEKVLWVLVDIKLVIREQHILLAK